MAKAKRTGHYVVSTHWDREWYQPFQEYRHRLVNLRKIYPYIPKKLNNVLLHFSKGTDVFYDTVDEMLGDLKPCLDLLGS